MDFYLHVGIAYINLYKQKEYIHLLPFLILNENIHYYESYYNKLLQEMLQYKQVKGEWSIYFNVFDRKTFIRIIKNDDIINIMSE
tara:strand:+ start:13353 stop:13607 length:255 start_codon:yes stop_codon:yes gene_type:complete